MSRARIRDMESYPDISASERALFASYCDFQDEQGRTFLSMERAGRLAGVCERQARRLTNRMIDRGWMSEISSRKGGFKKVTTYQLHREPKPGHSYVPLSSQKTRTQSCPPLPQKPGHKPGHFEHETRTFEAENPDIAMSGEVIEVFEVGKSSSSEAPTTVVGETEPEQPTTATAALFSRNENRESWREIEAAIWQRIDGGARQRIEASLGEQGFTVKHLVAYLKRYPISRKAKNPVGVLIAKAKSLSTELSAIDPDDPEPPKSEFDERMRRDYACALCGDTGRLPEPHPIRTKVTAACNCDAGKRAEVEDYESIANQLLRRKPESWPQKLAEITAAGMDAGRISALMGIAT